ARRSRPRGDPRRERLQARARRREGQDEQARAQVMSAGGKLGNYELEELLGRGGMAEVFRARCTSGPREGQVFALKRLLPELQSDPEYVSMFAGEADVIRFLDHPNIVKVHEVGADGDTYFMVMELIDGRD